jgi:iron complex outermembrane recepter protein
MRSSLPAAIVGLVVSGVASAQNAAGTRDNDDRLDEVIVSAQKRLERELDVPMSMEVITSAKMQEFNILQFGDVIKLTPGLNFNTIDMRSPGVTMRGLTSNSDNSAAAAVDIYWDEIPVTPQLAFRAMYDMEQVEVLRGPQGTTRGRGAPGGAIVMRLQRPNFSEFDGFVSTTFSDQSLSNYQAGLSIPIITDKLAVRVSGLYGDNPGPGLRNWADNRDSTTQEKSARVMLAWKGENFNAALTHHWLKGFAYGDYVQAFGAPTYGRDLPVLSMRDRVSLTTPATIRNDELTITSLAADWTLGRFRDDAIAGDQKKTSNLLASINDYTSLIPVSLGYLELTNILMNPSSQTNAELRLSAEVNRFWTFMVAAYYEDLTNNEDGFISLTLPLWFDTNGDPRPPDAGLPIFSRTPTNSVTTEQFFTNQTFNLGDRWRVEAGARVQKVDIRRSSGLTTERPTTTSASVKYKWNDYANSYVSYARSYRPGGTGTTLGIPGMAESLRDFGSEYSNAFEIGFKGELFDRRLRIHADVFQQTFDSFIGSVAGLYAAPNRDGVLYQAAPTFGITFNGDAKAEGVELSVNGNILPRWQLGFAVSYVKSAWDNALVPGNQFDANGNPFVPIGQQIGYVRRNDKLSPVPEFSGNITSEYRWTRGSYEPYVRGLFRYQGANELWGVVINDPNVSAYGILDLFVGVSPANGKWDVSLFAKNVTDDLGINYIGDPQVVNGWRSGYSAAGLSLPREFGIIARYNF